jgi:parvulin-like peptidyl-prolyl isomerase
MSKKSKTTGIPAPNARVADTRRYRSRAERDAYLNGMVLKIAAAIAGVIILILVLSLVIEGLIVPNQAVASVAGTNITTRDFQRRVTFERWRTGNMLGSIYNTYGAQFAQQIFTQEPYSSAYQQLSSPLQMGKSVLDQMANAILIKKYADENNIKVDDAIVNEEVYKYFGYQPTPMTETPTTTPSTTPTALVSATPSSTPTITPAPSQTVTPSVTPFPTGIPTVTPGPTEQKVEFDKNSKDYFERAAKATGLTENEIRAIFAEQALQEKVKEAIAGKPQDQQEQIKARHILVTTEEQANDVMKALQNGESFASLAQAISLDDGNQDTEPGGPGGSAAQGGELGWQGKGGGYVKEFEDALWNENTKIGDVLGPIKTEFGYHIIQVEGKEMRTLTESEKTTLQNKAFSDWLTQQQKDKYQTFDTWLRNVPEKPVLGDFGLPEGLLSQQGAGGFPMQ